MATLRYITRQILSNTIKADNKLQVNNTRAVWLRYLNYSPIVYDESRNPAPFFFDQRIQTLLKTLTRVDFAKVFRKRKLGASKVSDPEYKFMTDEELQESIKKAARRANKLLQIPPAVSVHKPKDRIVAKDPALQGLESCRMVFTDITFGLKDCDRLIVVREPDGTLQEAEWELRYRMNQLYFPRKTRSLRTPKMFEDAYLETLLDRQEYEFILDAACVQFEPDDYKYQQVTSVTYQHINDKNGFDIVRSTRHFGALAFFLAWNKDIDNLLLDLIESSRIDEGNCLVELYCKIHGVPIESSSELEAIEEYIEKYSSKKSALQLAVQAYKELAKQNDELKKGIEVAHGIS
ncbi:hypothetical protein NQ315_008084 [Exocentrus adspersus]|uniref:28S ribosomal protein S22, mitochondrial n=1 Tax=Exocentrus adspersus TaxID=1586481 RepID=A0AAV8VVL7_9CUCU|nr:hypothetical protein NQ315_008084 [Exocentrus adspersus]